MRDKREVFRPEADQRKIRRSCASFDLELGSCCTMVETVCAYKKCSFYITPEKARENALKSAIRRKEKGMVLLKNEEKMLEDAGIVVAERGE